MKLSKQTIRILIFLFIAVLLFSIGTYFVIQIVRNARMRTLYAKYDACSEELNLVIDFLQHKYPDHKKQPVYLRVAGGKMLLDPQNGFIDIPDEVSRLLTVLDEKCFVHEAAKLYVITFYGSRIQFDIQNGAYALVYSPEGEPEFLHQANEGFPIKVAHIEGDWYHVSRVG